jgi:3D (Asp-Asp-Asp) domain-containing protein
VACNWLPFGTKIKIQGFNVPKVVEDRMARRFSDRIDIYYRQHREAQRFGKKRLKVEVWR